MPQDLIIADGDLTPAFRALYDLDTQRKWRFTIAQHRNKRSLSQNALYWLILHALAHSSECGHSANELHEFYKMKFAPPVPKEVAGETILVRKTSTLTTAQFTTYLEQIYAHAADFFGVHLPAPDDRYWLAVANDTDEMQ